MGGHLGRRTFLRAAGLVAAGTTLSAGVGRTADEATLWYGGPAIELFSDVIPTGDGGWLAVGQSTARGNGVGWAVAFTPRGDTQWIRQYASPPQREQRERGGPLVADAFEFALPAADSHLLVGWTYRDADAGKVAWLVDVDPDGTKRWERFHRADGREAFESTFADGVRTPDGGYLLVGVTNASAADDETRGDGWLAKFDGQGNKQWERTCNPANRDHAGWSDDTAHDEFTAVIRASDGDYVLVGEATPVDGTGSVGWLRKIGPRGETRWDRLYRRHGDADAQFWDVSAGIDGSYVLAGASGTDGFWADAPPGSGATMAGDGWLVKVDVAGTVQWQQRYLGAVVRSVAATPDGYLLAGARDGRAWAVTVDSDGGNPADVARRYDPRSEFRSIAGTGGDYLLAGFGPNDATGSTDGLLDRVTQP